MCNKGIKFLLLFSLLFLFSCSGKGETESSTTPQEKPSVPDNGNGGGEENNPENNVTPLPDNIELGESTVQLNYAQLDNIVSVDEDNATISFSASTPEAQIPQVGQIILQLEPTESMPFGFLGRVTNVVNNGTAIVVETEAPALSEAFDKLEFDEELKILPAPSSLQSSSATRMSWGTDEYGYYYYTLDAHGDVEIKKGVTVGLEGDITFKSKTTSRGQYNKDLGKQDIDFDIKTKITTGGVVVKIAGKADNSDSKFLKAPIGPAIPFTGLLGKISVEAALQLYAGGKLSGEAGLKWALASYEGAKSFNLKGENGKWVKLQPSSDDGSDLSDPKGDWSFSPELSFYLDGSAMLGFFTSFELKLFGRDEYKLSLSPYAGYEISSGQNLINFADIKYEESKDVHVTGAFVAGVEASVKAEFFKRDVEASFFDVMWRGAEIHRYIFPSFDGSCVINGETNRAECEVAVERDLLIPLGVGVGQYEDDKPVEYSPSEPYYLNKNFPNPYTASFAHQKDNSYWTYVKLLNKYVKCKELEVDELRVMLEKFYQDTGGDNWKCNDNWCTDAPLNEWYGVTLYEDGDLVELSLSLVDNNLVGSGTLSGCTSLVELDCYNNQLTSLDLSGCTSLRGLYCHTNQLTSLDVSGCTSLEGLSCAYNHLTSLDVSDCTSLVYMHCGYNQLKSLDVSGYTSLRKLDCYNNQLTSLNVSGCTSLYYLDCTESQLTSLDVSGCTSLKALYCLNNQLVGLYISGCASLEFLECSNNRLTSLNVSGCTLLWSLNCNANQLTSLYVSGCTSLEGLHCNANQLISLNVSGCASLRTLECSNNQLTSLNVSGYTSLRHLNCSNNQLKSLNVSGCASLEYLDCRNNKITQEITEFYQEIQTFLYDKRYTNYHYEPIYDSKGDEIGSELRYTDNEGGWWYPGEPEKGYHGK